MVKNTLTLKERILKYLIENKKHHSIREISKKLKTDYKNVFQSIKKFPPKIIFKERIGNSNLVGINLSPSQEIFSIENKRTELFLKENLRLKLIKKDVEEIGYPFMVVLIFGSVVKKTNTKNSDLDLCIISDDRGKEKELIEKLNLLPLKIEVHNFTYGEFLSMIERKKLDISDEIIKENIILFGIENYYNLISKWMKKE